MFDPVPAQQELLKQLLFVRHNTLQNIKTMRQNIYDEDNSMRAKAVPFSERKVDMNRLIKCEQWIDWLTRTNFSHMLINEWAVENHDNPKSRAEDEALYYFESYCL